MNTHRFIMKTVIAIMLSCLLPALLIAQTDDPHITGNVPISFYGKVVDQNNQPISDVKVQLEIRVGKFTSPTTSKEKWVPISLASDANGNFTLADVKGSFVQFKVVEKNGYKLLPKQVKAGFMYYPETFHADSNNPVVFKMWKKHGEEPLVDSAWHGNIACDGTLMTFDLQNGKQDKDGSLQITCTRVPLDIVPRENKRYDYNLQIAIVGGSIQSTDDEFTYLAPEGGYVPSLTLGAKAEDPKWAGNVKQEFYIKTADGHYGRLSIDWYAELTSPTHFEWNCTINPLGSRNLER